VSDTPSAVKSDRASGFFANLLRPASSQPADAPAKFETAAAEPPSATASLVTEAAPISQKVFEIGTDGQLPIIVDPTLAEPARPAPSPPAVATPVAAETSTGAGFGGFIHPRRLHGLLLGVTTYEIWSAQRPLPSDSKGMRSPRSR